MLDPEEDPMMAPEVLAMLAQVVAHMLVPAEAAGAQMYVVENIQPELWSGFCC